MAYLDGYISTNIRLDQKCGKGWEGTQGKCKRSKKNKESRKEADKTPILTAGGAGILLLGAYQATQTIKQDLDDSSVDFESLRTPPGGVPDKQTMETYDSFVPGDLIVKNFKGQLGNRQHYAVYIGKDPKTGEHMAIDTGENWKTRDNIPFVGKRGLTWGASPNDSDYAKVEIPEENKKFTPEEIVERANAFLYSPFQYAGFDSNCEAFARMTVEGEAVSKQGDKISMITKVASAVVTDNALKMRTKNEFFPGAKDEKTLFSVAGRNVSGISDYAKIGGKMSAQQMQKHLEIKQAIKAGKTEGIPAGLLSIYWRNEEAIKIRKETWELIPNPYTGQIEKFGGGKKVLPPSKPTNNAGKGNAIPTNKAFEDAANLPLKDPWKNDSFASDKWFDKVGLKRPDVFAEDVAKQFPSNNGVFKEAKINAYKHYYLIMFSYLSPLLEGKGDQ